MNAAPGKLRALLMQALRFVGLSGIGWLLDFTVYTLLSTRVSNLAAVNMISSLVGASFVFAFSTRFVFRDNHASRYSGNIACTLPIRSCLSSCFAAARKINTLITTYISAALIVKYSAILSKIIVTPITMTLFFVMRFCDRKTLKVKSLRLVSGLIYFYSVYITSIPLSQRRVMS